MDFVPSHVHTWAGAVVAECRRVVSGRVDVRALGDGVGDVLCPTGQASDDASILCAIEQPVAQTRRCTARRQCNPGTDAVVEHVVRVDLDRMCSLQPMLWIPLGGGCGITQTTAARTPCIGADAVHSAASVRAGDCVPCAVGPAGQRRSARHGNSDTQRRCTGMWGERACPG